MIDPHSAIGYGAVEKAIQKKIISNNSPIISLACAHPAKFPQVIKKSIGITPKSSAQLEKIMSQNENFKIIEPNLKDIKEYIKKTMRK